MEPILTSPNGTKFGSSGSFPTTRFGIQLSSILIPRYAPAGTYVLSISTQDRVGNKRTYSQSQLAALGFPATVTIVDSNPDSTPPTVSAFSFTPAQIDVSTSSVNVVVRVSVQDNLSGVVPSFNTISRISGQPFVRNQAIPPTLISGTNLNGVWEGTYLTPFEKNTFAGIYSLESIEVCDLAGNCSVINGAPFNATLNVTSNPTDLQRPKLLFFDFTPKVVNTTFADQNITFTSSWSDDVSGFASPPFIRFLSPSTGVSPTTPASCELISSGNLLVDHPRSVTYRCIASLPWYSEVGQWTILGLGISDATGFGAALAGAPLDTATLAGLGFPTRFSNSTSGGSPDGVIGPIGGSVSSSSIPSLSLSAPPNLFAVPSSVYLRSGTASANFPVPQGFSAAASNLITIDLDPPPASPLAFPGSTITIPLSSTLPSGVNLVLYRLDPNSGALTPVPSVLGGFSTAFVNVGGQSATFTGIGAFPSFVAFRRNAEVIGDASGDGVVNCADVAIVKASLGKRINQPGFDARADLNRDNVVDIRDLTSVIRLLPSGLVCP